MKSLLQKSPDLYIYLLLHFTITHVKKNNKYWNSFVDSLLHCREHSIFTDLELWPPKALKPKTLTQLMVH